MIHGCSTSTLKLLSLVIFFRLREAPLLALRHMVHLYLISGGGPGDIRGGINITNLWRTVREQLPNTNIDSNYGEDTKYHASFSVFLG